MLYQNVDLRGLVQFILNHTAGEKDLRFKVFTLQRSYDKVVKVRKD